MSSDPIQFLCQAPPANVRCVWLNHIESFWIHGSAPNRKTQIAKCLPLCLKGWDWQVLCICMYCQKLDLWDPCNVCLNVVEICAWKSNGHHSSHSNISTLDRCKLDLKLHVTWSKHVQTSPNISKYITMICVGVLVSCKCMHIHMYIYTYIIYTITL